MMITWTEMYNDLVELKQAIENNERKKYILNTLKYLIDQSYSNIDDLK